MSTTCEFTDGCPITRYFGEQGLKLMLNRYCYGGFQKCARYQLRTSGQDVPEYTMPWDGLTELGSMDDTAQPSYVHTD